VSKGRKILLAFLAALLGFLVGAVTISAIGTLKLVLMPGMEYASGRDLVRGAPLIFLEGLMWAVVGGTMYVLPAGFLLLAAYALKFRLEWLEPYYTRMFVFGLAALLYAPLVFFGPRDVLLLVIPMLLGAWVSVRFLNHRLSRGGR
jgi:hypothetical protein